MIRHIVMYKFKEEAEGRSKKENLIIAKELARDMESNIPQLIRFQCSIGSEQQVDSNFDVALICDIEDSAALAEYKKNPVHKAFGAHCHAVSEARAAIDFDI